MKPGKRSTDFEDYPAELAPYTLRNPRYQIAEGYKRAEKIGKFIEGILTGPYPWHRLRSARRYLGFLINTVQKGWQLPLQRPKHIASMT